MGNGQVRTRFAPSPTGYLHVGGARTALFNYLFARHHGGEFVLRIEDTDLARSTEASIAAIYAGMDWLGLAYDGTPVRQTERTPLYQQAIDALLSSGQAYRCTCSKERLTELREAQMAAKQKPRYDGHCRDLNLGEDVGEHVIRFKNPESGSVSFTDLIRGEITVSNAELDDLIIARSDGSPTYNLTVVIDDADMEITHVIRGDDHINNTPRQINLLRALGKPLPQYAHVPMILGADGKRLSKRHGAVSVTQYRDDGFLAPAMVNYLARLGWSHGDDEVFSLAQLEAYFDLANVSRSAASFNIEKLTWLNQHYLKTLPMANLEAATRFICEQSELEIGSGPALSDVITMQQERAKTLVELVEKSRYFYEPIAEYDAKAVKKHLTADARAVLEALQAGFSALPEWEASALHRVVIATSEELSLKLGKVAQPLRVALTGSTVSPSIDVTLLHLGRERVLERLEKAISIS